VPLRWNSNVLTYVSAAAGPLWSAIQVADPPLAQVRFGGVGRGARKVGGWLWWRGGVQPCRTWVVWCV
jgi:hypothetical protein